MSAINLWSKTNDGTTIIQKSDGIVVVPFPVWKASFHSHKFDPTRKPSMRNPRTNYCYINVFAQSYFEDIEISGDGYIDYGFDKQQMITVNTENELNSLKQAYQVFKQNK